MSQSLDSLASGPSPERWYADFRRREGFEPDRAQASAVERLQALHEALINFKLRPRGFVSRTFQKHRHAPPKGLYLWGGVGRGKSALMDAFFAGLPYRRKARYHFHPFMRDVHAALKRHSSESDPLHRIADDIAKSTRVLCFDEFHVSDIADAMILGRLFGALFERGVVLVMTSNYPPSGLYPDGLQRDRFIPTIALIEANVNVLCVDGGVDHRLRTLHKEQVFFTPLGQDSDQRIAQLFERVSGQSPEASTLMVLGRALPVRAQARAAVWFDFKALCDGPRSQLDYLFLAERFPLVIVSDIPRLTPKDANLARRLTWLVDILYDHHIPIAISSEVSVSALYAEGPMHQEFARTVSRLEEMQSVEWKEAQAAQG